MEGNLDFKDSLKRRVKLLKNCPISLIGDLKKRLIFTEGAVDLCKVLKKLNFKMAVISGGFTPIALDVQKTLSLDYAYANNLETDGGFYTGNLVGEIINAEKKQDLLLKIANREGLVKNEIIAIGDGANDLKMLSAAGTGIAFNAKPIVREQAQISINQPNLMNILYLLGYDDDKIKIRMS
jgi:phosphoserine phosphatase SerB